MKTGILLLICSALSNILPQSPQMWVFYIGCLIMIVYSARYPSLKSYKRLYKLRTEIRERKKRIKDLKKRLEEN